MNGKMTIGIFSALVIGAAGGGALWHVFRPTDDHATHENGGHAEEHGEHENAHAGNEEHDPEKGEGHEEGLIRLSPEALRLYRVEVAEAGPGRLQRTIRLTGEIQPNADRLAHIVPRVSGIVREVRKTLGDHVETGELLAVLDSRELADAKAADLAATGRLSLAQASYTRVETLLARKIAPEEELLKAKQALAEAEIEHDSAEAKLHALGLTEEQVKAMHTGELDVDYPRYEIKAPFAGTIIDKHITLGELVDSETTTFTIADLSNVWGNFTVYTQDLPRVTAGTHVTIVAEGIPPQEAAITYLSPVVNEATRTGLVRAVVANPRSHWRPGLFVSATVVINEEEVPVLVPESALQTIDNQTVLFVEDGDAFVVRPVEVGRRSGKDCEIIAGLAPSDRYVASGGFILKAELGKGAAEHEH